MWPSERVEPDRGGVGRVDDNNVVTAPVWYPGEHVCGEITFRVKNNQAPTGFHGVLDQTKHDR